VYGDYEDAGHVFDPEDGRAIEELQEHSQNRFIVGGPETVIREFETFEDTLGVFETFEDTLGVDEFLLRMHFPGLDPEKAEKSMRILAEKVMPHFAE
jgi:alkanesulfonate monooxygenase SsuD/methylene tetrahydromethanopterin reductase-like flavin-dependent oxidoreductase (luciferase family)